MGVGMMGGDEVVVGIEVGVGVDHREDGGRGKNGIDGDEEAMKGRGCPMMGDDHMALVDSLSHFDATFCSRGRFSASMRVRNVTPGKRFVVVLDSRLSRSTVDRLH